ncbi:MULTISPECIES: helix-turn-helix domain-containing protein [unclassified Virgibacillus]|uniref:helix-turn-helix transcriptional regulator n=1 Tax=unclassified Virgibacillus TaxID=2620237 RepID=UPI0024DEC1F7|nr:helix-turn-helix domain-containing protein [Virgibacillus sp. LDC-1]
MERTLKVTNVLSDPTRFNIYQYVIKKRKEVTVNEIAEEFGIHANVSRLHLSKLEDINLLVSYSQKTGKGGRPSRLYRLSNEVVELNFPHRDYKMLSAISLETFAELGDIGRKALYDTGRKYGAKIMERYQTPTTTDLTVEQKLQILEDAGTMLGLYPDFTYFPNKNTITFHVNNCPFKEVALKNQSMVCKMHNEFIQGMFESLFSGIELVETENILQGCENCTYVAKFSVI